jgi:hypothetical protein
MVVAILAALAMFAQDLIAVPLVQAESRTQAHLAGLLDTVGWLVAIATTFISVNTLQGHNTTEKVLVIVLVSGANYLGTLTGTKLGKRFVKEDATSLADRVKVLETVVLHTDRIESPDT